MHLDEIFASQPNVKKSTRDYHIKQLTNQGKIERVQNGIYRKPASTDTQTQLNAETRKKFSSKVRSAEDNEATISELLNEYDDLFKEWIADNGIDFEKRLENFKWLTMIVDKLMKRWSLVHVGYDTNTRQAQEDAKAKTELREQEALKNAPLEDTIVVVGHYKEGFQEILEHLPKKEAEDISV